MKAGIAIWILAFEEVIHSIIPLLSLTMKPIL